MNYLTTLARHSLALALAGGLAARAQAGQTLRLGPIDFMPTLVLSEGYSTNIFNQNIQKKASSFTRISPIFKFSRKWNLLDFNMSYALTATLYASYPQNDTTNHKISGVSRYDFNHRNKLELTSGLCFCENPIGINLSQGSLVTANSKPVKYSQQNYLATYIFGSQGAKGNLIFKAGYNQINYDNQIITANTGITYRTSTLDNHSIILGGSFLYKLMPKTSAILEINNNWLTYTVQQPNSLYGNYSQTNYLAGATWKAAAKTTGTVKLGLYHIEFDDRNRKPSQGVTGSLNIVWQPWTYSGFTLTAAQINQPVIGVGTGSYINQKQFSLAWSHNWNQSLSNQVQLSGGTQDYVGTNPAISDTIIGASLGLTYNMQPWLGFGLNYTYNRRDSNRNSYNFDQNMVVLNVNMAL